MRHSSSVQDAAQQHKALHWLHHVFIFIKGKRGESVTSTDAVLINKKLPWVCRPTEHLAAVFDDVLVAVRVLESVLPRPGTFNLVKTKKATTEPPKSQIKVKTTPCLGYRLSQFSFS